MEVDASVHTIKVLNKAGVLGLKVDRYLEKLEFSGKILIGVKSKMQLSPVSCLCKIFFQTHEDTLECRP